MTIYCAPRYLAALLLLLAGACSSSEQPADTPGDAAMDAPQVANDNLCATPLASQLGADTAVSAMEQAAKEYEPTDEELKTAVAYLVLLADARQTGRLHPNFFKADLQTRMLTLAKKYPSFFAPCAGTGESSFALIGSKTSALKVPDCDDDCAELIWDAVGKQLKDAGMMLLDRILAKVLADDQGSKLVAQLKKEYDAANTHIFMIKAVTADNIEKVARVVADFMATVLSEVPGLQAYALAIEVGIFAIDTARALADAQVDYEDCLAMQQKLCQDAGPPDGPMDGPVPDMAPVDAGTHDLAADAAAVDAVPATEATTAVGDASGDAAVDAATDATADALVVDSAPGAGSECPTGCTFLSVSSAELACSCPTWPGCSCAGPIRWQKMAAGAKAYWNEWASCPSGWHCGEAKTFFVATGEIRSLYYYTPKGDGPPMMCGPYKEWSIFGGTHYLEKESVRCGLMSCGTSHVYWAPPSPPKTIKSTAYFVDNAGCWEKSYDPSGNLTGEYHFPTYPACASQQCSTSCVCSDYDVP